MSKALTLRDRMKQYETVTKNWLTLRTPKVIRLDMKGGAGFCKGFEQPFDDLFSRCMMKTAQDLCQQIPGVVFAYTQSDKISLVLNDVTEDDKTESWCDGCVNKMVALSASLATLAFNKAFAEEVSKLHDVELDKIYGPKQWTAAFDSRAFCLPDIWEVRNYILWCQQEAAANSVQLAGAAEFGAKEVEGKNPETIKKMLEEKGKKWADYPERFRRGCLIGPAKIKSTALDMKLGEVKEIVRKSWEAVGTPDFAENSDILKKFFERK